MNEIFLNPFISLILIAFSVYLVLKGKIGISTGIYTALPSFFTIIRFIHNVNHIWIYMLTMVGSLLVYRGTHDSERIIPQRGRWIILWFGGWLIFVLIQLMVLNNSEPELRRNELMSFCLYLVIPIPSFLLLANNNKEIRGFAVSYIMTMIIGAGMAIFRLSENLNISIINFLKNPLLTNIDSNIMHFYAVKMQISNYHVFAYGIVIALLLSVPLYYLYNNTAIRLALLICTIYLFYCLSVANSRQSFFVGITLYIFFMRNLVKRLPYIKYMLFLIILIILVTMIDIFRHRPEELMRHGSNLYSSLNPFAERIDAWVEGWIAFVNSPLLGESYVRTSSLGHNYFIGTLANQGIIGFIFIMGFMVFYATLLRGAQNWSINSEDSLWKLMFLYMGLFSFLVGQVSGGPVGNWPITWAAAALWRMQTQNKRKIAGQNGYMVHKLSCLKGLRRPVI